MIERNKRMKEKKERDERRKEMIRRKHIHKESRLKYLRETFLLWNTNKDFEMKLGFQTPGVVRCTVDIKKKLSRKYKCQ